jgi:DNA-binding transcriptional regulator YiaG
VLTSDNSTNNNGNGNGASGSGDTAAGDIVSPEVRDTISRAVRESAVLRRQLTDTEEELKTMRKELSTAQENFARTLRVAKLEYVSEVTKVRDEYEAQLTVLRQALTELDPRYAN